MNLAKCWAKLIDHRFMLIILLEAYHVLRVLRGFRAVCQDCKKLQSPLKSDSHLPKKIVLFA